MNLTDAPRARLLDGPTPLQRMPRIESLTGHHGLYVKRDDSMSLGMGGNKLRSLEFWLGDARERGSDVLLVAGKPVSNQCRLTAAAAAKCGLDCVIVYNDDPPAGEQGNLLLSRLFGADIRFVGPVDEAERERRLHGVRDELAAAGRVPYIVGDPVVGALGYVAAAFELHQQVLESGIALRHAVLPGSMGVTEAGFLFGCALLGGPFDVHLVSVEYGIDELRRRVDDVYRALAERTGVTPAVEAGASTRYYDAYLGDGYELPTREALAAIRTFAGREGLLLEMTYTSKPFAALLDLIDNKTLPVNEPVCMLHTGGLPALFGQAETLDGGKVRE